AVRQNDDAFGLEQPSANGIGINPPPKYRSLFNGAGEGCRGGIAHGLAVLVEGGLREDTSKLGLPSLGGTVGLLALAPLAFPSNRRHARTVHLDVQGLDRLWRVDGRLHEARAFPFSQVLRFKVSADILRDALGILSRQLQSRQFP